MNAAIITIGDELLIGQIVDTNATWMAEQLTLNGFVVDKITTISDKRTAILETVDTAFEDSDIILVTGGLGPTKDDITKKTLADYFGLELQLDESVLEYISTYFKNRGVKFRKQHKEQSFMPKGCKIFLNPMGTAPGMVFEKNNKVLVSMPGVPYEMKALMTGYVLPFLQEKFVRQSIFHKTIRTAGLPESYLAKKMETFEQELPPHIKLAYLPSLGEVKLRLSAIGNNGETQSALEEEVLEKKQEVEAIFGNDIYGEDKQNIETALGELLITKGKTIATVESCTGGYVAHKITSISGSSAYFMGSIVAYSNQVKVEQVGVDPSIIEKHGAVSEQTVRAMVKGVVKSLKTDYVIATSGIAGPGGGTAQKPVGTIWIAVGSMEKVETLKININKTRVKNIQYTTSRALNMMRKFLLAE